MQRDDYVDDSENEDELLDMGQAGRTLSQISVELEQQAHRAKTIEATSYTHISAFSTMNADAGPSKVASSINQFTSPAKGATMGDRAEATSSISAIETPMMKPPRPKPRPIVRKKPVTDDIAPGGSSVSNFSFLDQIANHNPGMRQLDDFPSSTIDDSLAGFPGMSSIADRAKTRQRRTTSTQGIYQDAPGPGTDDDDDYADKPSSSKSKSKARTSSDKSPPLKKKQSSAKSKTKKATPILSSEVIELTDDSEDDELNLKRKTKGKSSSAVSDTTKSSSGAVDGVPDKPPRPKPGPVERKAVDGAPDKPPRPKPRPIQRNPVVADGEGPSGTTNSSSGVVLDKPPRPKPRPVQRKPVVTDGDSSGIPPLIADTRTSREAPARHPLIPSSLPPSDFSLSQFAPPGGHFDVPPIETLPRPSSSSHKQGSDFDELFDELLSGDDDDIFKARVPPKSGPPPTFFAGSSSFPSHDNAHDVQHDGLDVDKAMDVIDISILSTLAPPNPDVTNTDKPVKPKARKSKKAKDGDDDDEGWDPQLQDRGGAPKKNKRAPKKKALVEVLIMSRPGPNASGDGLAAEDNLDVTTTTKKKGKAKEKSAPSGSRKKGKGKEIEEVFKSKEFIEDSDEDPLLAPPIDIGLPSGASSSAGVHSTPSFLSPTLPPPPLSPLSDIDFEMDNENERTSGAKAKQGKKRKSMVIEDEEEDVFDEPALVEETPSKRQKSNKASAKKTKEKKSKKGAAKQPAAVEDPEPSQVDQIMEDGPVDVGGKATGKRRRDVVFSDDEEEETSKLASSSSVKSTIHPETPQVSKNSKQSEPVEQSVNQENVRPSLAKPQEAATPKPVSLHQRYSIGPRKSTPMSELIKKVNAMPSSPFPISSSARTPSIGSKATAYSPYLKSSRSALSRIAPLHPNRRTPPPPLPPPPPKKKTKKELEREERWEEELIDSLGGIEVWAAMSDVERKDLRKGKFDMEMGCWE